MKRLNTTKIWLWRRCRRLIGESLRAERKKGVGSRWLRRPDRHESRLKGVPIFGKLPTAPLTWPLLPYHEKMRLAACCSLVLLRRVSAALTGVGAVDVTWNVIAGRTLAYRSAVGARGVAPRAHNRVWLFPCEYRARRLRGDALAEALPVISRCGGHRCSGTWATSHPYAQ